MSLEVTGCFTQDAGVLVVPGSLILDDGIFQ